MGGNGKFRRWKFSFHRSSAKHPPEEFLCPISNSLMSDPTVVSSGQSFDRVCVDVCRDLGFTPTLADGSTPDLSNVIPNLALKDAILNWCSKSGSENPTAPAYSDIVSTVRSLSSSSVKNQQSPKIPDSESKTPSFLLPHAATELNLRKLYSSSSSVESVIANTTPLLPFETRPSCFSSSSSPSPSTSSEFASSSGEDEGFITKMRSLDIYEQEQAVIQLRKTTRTNEESRSTLCSEKLLSCLKTLLDSRYAVLQTNSAAALVNLSLEKSNKVKIVRSGIVPLLIDILKNGFEESREHAAGAIFSLSLDDVNKTAIGVLGALQPLLHELRCGTRRSRHDSALALYHLTLVGSNRAKMVRLGAAGVLLGMLTEDADLAARVLLVVCNLAGFDEGRAALMDAGAVGCLVGVLRDGAESTRENCVACLHSLSYGSLRFKGLAREAGCVEVLREVVETGSDRAREKARRVLEVLRGPVESGEVDWEAVMKDGVSHGRHKPSQEANSTEF